MSSFDELPEKLRQAINYAPYKIDNNQIRAILFDYEAGIPVSTIIRQIEGFDR